MDSNNGYLKLETTQDKLKKIWAKISVKAKEKAFVERVVKQKRDEGKKDA